MLPETYAIACLPLVDNIRKIVWVLVGLGENDYIEKVF